MKAEDFTYIADANGYIVLYKGKPVYNSETLIKNSSNKADTMSNKVSAEATIKTLVALSGSNIIDKIIPQIDEEEAKSEKERQIIERVKQALDGMYWDNVKDGVYYYEIGADYNDIMGEKTAGDILLSKCPEEKFNDIMDEWYSDTLSYEVSEIIRKVKNEIEDDEELFPDGYDEDLVAIYVQDHTCITYPEDHFLDQEFCVNIMLDTGDGNYDYTLNSVYPCYYGRYEERIDDKAGIVWLTRQQGYTKTDLWMALRYKDDAETNTFLGSMRDELVNLPSHMSTVTFLTRMTLRQLIELNKAISWSEKDGIVYDARKKPSCGYIIIDKKAVCGLYDPWGGGGSILEIELEKDVRLPIKYIRCALPDEVHCKYEYSIGSVYGMCHSAWKEDTVKEIHIPKKVREAI